MYKNVFTIVAVFLSCAVLFRVKDGGGDKKRAEISRRGKNSLALQMMEVSVKTSTHLYTPLSLKINQKALFS